MAFVLPGVVYQYVRERWRGPRPAEQQIGERILRALVASLTLDALYAVAAGPQLVRLSRSGNSWFQGLAEHPRTAGLWTLALYIAIPAAAAAAVTWRERRTAQSVFRPAPTAWDYVFGDRIAATPRFVRARLKDGRWVGGWYGPRSFASGYPNPNDLYLEREYEMNADGSFGAAVQSSAGFYLRAEDSDILEFINPVFAPAAQEGKPDGQ